MERSGSGVSFRAMREEKAEHERKESEREERERRKINLHDSDGPSLFSRLLSSLFPDLGLTFSSQTDDDDRVNGGLRAARRSSVATTVDARRRKTSEKDVVRSQCPTPPTCAWLLHSSAESRACLFHSAAMS
jgi:hypothetical protein